MIFPASRNSGSLSNERAAVGGRLVSWPSNRGTGFGQRPKRHQPASRPPRVESDHARDAGFPPVEVL